MVNLFCNKYFHIVRELRLAMVILFIVYGITSLINHEDIQSKPGRSLCAEKDMSRNYDSHQMVLVTGCGRSSHTICLAVIPIHFYKPLVP